MIPGPGLSLIPEDSATYYALATQLNCWARQADGTTDSRILSLTCKAARYFYIPPEVCAAGYGPLPFTSEGNEIVCDPNAVHQMDRTIWPEDVAPLNIETCTGEGVQLGTPTGVSASNVMDTSFYVSWSGVPGATSYTIRYRTGSGDWVEVTSSTPNVSLTGLEPGATYQVQVKATNADDGYTDSLWSSGLLVTTGTQPGQVVTVVWETDGDGNLDAEVMAG